MSGFVGKIRNPHPLDNNKKWQCFQPYMRIDVKFPLGEEDFKQLEISNTCREGIISSIYGYLRSSCCKQNPAPGGYWARKTAVHLKPTLLERMEEIIPSWKLSISPSALSPKTGTPPGEGDLEKFYSLVDTVAGNLTLLLDPYPYKKGALVPGNGGKKGSLLRYRGIGPGILYHPALVAIALGLYRQAAFLLHAGVADEVLASVDQDRVRLAIASVDRELARENVEKCIKWICVPYPLSGFDVGSVTRSENYTFIPFPKGYRQRLRSMVAACQKDYKAVYGENVETSWALAGDMGLNFNGVWGWLGKAHKKSDNPILARIKEIAGEEKSAGAEAG